MAVTFNITIPGEAAVALTVSTEAVTAITSFIQRAPTQVTSLTADATNVATTLTLASNTGISSGNGIVLNNGSTVEVCLVTAFSNNVATVVRARLGTTASAWTSGQSVNIIKDGSYGTFIADVIGFQLQNAMVITPGPTITAANTIIATQNANIASALSVAVTHVP